VYYIRGCVLCLLGLPTDERFGLDHQVLDGVAIFVSDAQEEAPSKLAVVDLQGELVDSFAHLHDDMVFIGHSAPFWAEIGQLETPYDRAGYPNYPVKEEGVLPKLMRRYPNLYGDLSAGSGFNALNRDHAYAIKFLNEFQDRLLFGTDICAPAGKAPLADFLLGLRRDKKISENVFQKIARKNAIKLLNL